MDVQCTKATEVMISADELLNGNIRSFFDRQSLITLENDRQLLHAMYAAEHPLKPTMILFLHIFKLTCRIKTIF